MDISYHEQINAPCVCGHKRRVDIRDVDGHYDWNCEFCKRYGKGQMTKREMEAWR
jgi:phage/plasmid primase-like uncharacterized protein